MRVLAQMVLPFRVEATDEKLSANAGLVLFGEFIHGLGFNRWLQQDMPKPGSGHSYAATAYVTPLVNPPGAHAQWWRPVAGGYARPQERLCIIQFAETEYAAERRCGGRLVARTGAGKGLAWSSPHQSADRYHAESSIQYHSIP